MGHGPTDIGQALLGDRLGADDREPPVVEGDLLGEQFGTDACAEVVVADGAAARTVWPPPSR